MALPSAAKLKIIAGCLLVGATLSAMISIVTIAWTYQWLRHAETAEATIVALVKRETSDKPHYKPKFTFTDRQGASHLVTSSTGSSPPRYQVGDRVTVFFDPSYPEKARLPDFFSLWGLAFVTGMLAIIYAVGGWLLWRYSKRRSQLESVAIKPLATPPAHP